MNTFRVRAFDRAGKRLRALGMEVTTASDGFAALAEMERAWHCGRPYDVAFLDQMMPGSVRDGSGRAGSRLIRGPGDQTCARLLGRIDSLPAQSRASLDAVLDKPVRQRELLDCLARVYSADGRAAAGKSASAAARPSTSSSFLVTETRMPPRTGGCTSWLPRITR